MTAERRKMLKLRSVARIYEERLHYVLDKLIACGGVEGGIERKYLMDLAQTVHETLRYNERPARADW